ncbi:MAG: 30S ribosomal protein S17 [Candidatus Magasanikbacteria bacterium GW2011_GWC2_34_16]|uniref:Small ribosomal subunit protein uS17 n=1 Tax=Candidatus Magasanikbacteria bacterium GW2011_GWC2_34_16 TaxID=1619045 RepID=A0A0G0DWX8_9BACT|nr:MAG: 30S ribosomal protein S17 [Candidatus Magasanikbacteria bacterium GW2011_GWC2_34_16]
MTTESKTINIRQFVGLVTSAKMDKTIVVKVDRMKENLKYHKSFRVSKKYHVHDEKGLAKEGDKVEFCQCRPLSKTKCWRLVKVLN